MNVMDVRERDKHFFRGMMAGLVAALSVVLLTQACTDPAQATPRRVAVQSAAVPGVPTPAVGVLFDPVDAGHVCTGVVVGSTAGADLVMTAAHCMAGTGAGYRFAPGYSRAGATYGVWPVQSVYVDPRWITGQDPQHDYALLRLDARNGHRVRELTGGYALAPAAAAGTVVRVPGYLQGVNDDPITCNAVVYLTAGFPGFNCGGYWDGVSGAPFLTATGRPVITGVIGGLHQGGCVDSTSYSARFVAADVGALYRRARLAQPSDTVPVAGPPGC